MNMQKLLIIMLGLLPGIIGTACAQQGTANHRIPEDELFNLPHYSIHYDWRISLGKGNYLDLELTGLDQLPRFQNIDSLLLVFLSDMKTFKDSLANPITNKRIDYLIDTNGHKMVRIRESAPAGTTWLLGDDEPALLRLRQDTIHILLLSPSAATAKKTIVLYNRLTLVINRYGDLETLVATGLDAKIHELGPTDNHSWNDKGQLIKDPSIRTGNDAIYSAYHERSFLSLDAIFAAQNYKNYFTPSVGLGVTMGLQNGPNWNRIGLHWEPLFFFAANAQDHSQTYRNDLLVLSYEYTTDKNGGALSPLGLMTNISIGIFLHREGDYFPKQSFRLTAGDVKLMHGRFFIEPCLYFNDFFRNVTPGLRFCFKAL